MPTVSSVTPNRGPTDGGTSVTVTGTNLSGETAVDFGTSLGDERRRERGRDLTDGDVAGRYGRDGGRHGDHAGRDPATSAADQFTYQNSGYWMVGTDGGIFSFGDAPFEGSLPGLGIHVTNVVGMVPTAMTTRATGWSAPTAASSPSVTPASWARCPGIGVHVNNIVGVVPTADGKGYWMVGTDGGVFAFGDAGFVGSLPGLNVHVVQHRGAWCPPPTARATG